MKSNKHVLCFVRMHSSAFSHRNREILLFPDALAHFLSHVTAVWLLPVRREAADRWGGNSTEWKTGLVWVDWGGGVRWGGGCQLLTLGESTVTAESESADDI